MDGIIVKTALHITIAAIFTIFPFGIVVWFACWLFGIPFLHGMMICFVLIVVWIRVELTDRTLTWRL